MGLAEVAIKIYSNSTKRELVPRVISTIKAL